MDLAGRGTNNIRVVCDDIVILMLHFYCGKNLNCGVIMESPVPGRKVVDIQATANQHETSQIIFQEYMHLAVVKQHHICMALEKLQP